VLRVEDPFGSHRSEPTVDKRRSSSAAAEDWRTRCFQIAKLLENFVMNARVLISNEPKMGKIARYLGTGHQPILDETKILRGCRRIKTLKNWRVVSNNLNNPRGFTTKSPQAPHD
jgi:hypothetical protein